MKSLFIILFVLTVPAIASAEQPSAADLLAEARGSDTKPAAAKKPTPKGAKKAAPIEPTEPADAPEDPDAPNPFGAASVLFLGAGVVALGAWGLQKWKVNRDGFTATTMSHVQSMRLGPKHQVSLVDVDGRQFLIGLAEGAITLLSEVHPQGHGEPVAAAPTTRDEAAGESTLTWSSVFDEARQNLNDSAGTDGRVTGRAQGVKAYQSAGHGGSGNIPRASEVDSVVFALERLENGSAS